jgi:signal transduction histidine kinase
MYFLNFKKHFAGLLLLLFVCAISNSQDSLLKNATDISKITIAKPISNAVSSAVIEKEENVENIYPGIQFTEGVKFKRAVPDKYVTKKIVLKFKLYNSADSSVSIYFMPGFYFDNINLFFVNGDKLTGIPRELPDSPDSIGFRKIKLNAHETTTVVAELSMIRTYIVTIRPRLVHTDNTAAFVAQLRSTHNNENLITYIFCGLLLMMILFSIANFLQGANPEFLYYSGYALFLGGMLFTKAVYDLRISVTSFFLESYLDFVLQLSGIIFYMIFMQKFLETKSKHPFLYKLYNIGIATLVISLINYTLFHYFSNNYRVENLTETSTKILLLVLIIIFLIYSLKHWNDKLLRYLFWGNLLLFVFAIISQLAVLRNDLFVSLPGVLNSSLFYYEAGLFLELVFFLSGLNYKNRSKIIDQTKERETLKAQNKLQEYEKELAVYKGQQDERERISADMHDELGAGMTAIRLLSEIARNKMKENTPVEIDKISHSANEVLNKMNAIIWSMNNSNDTLDNLISYIRSYSLEYFENTPIHCTVHTPENIPLEELTGDKRRNIFLSVKETLTNALKHSDATEITITITLDKNLKIIIADNGKGIDKENLRKFGNGLKNITRRMEAINGTFKIVSDNGTRTILELTV